MFRSFVTSSVLVCLALSAGARTRSHYGGALRIEPRAIRCGFRTVSLAGSCSMA